MPADQDSFFVTLYFQKDLPVYQPDVRVFDVFDADGKPLALYYGDYFSRPSKSASKWSLKARSTRPWTTWSKR